MNGRKIARLYGPWFHIATLPVGREVLRVTRNANADREIAVGGKTVAAEKTIVVPAPVR